MAQEAVEELLRLDPADAYGAMDSSSRDYYLSVIADLAKKSGAEERAVAAACLELARAGALAKGASAPEAHVGQYLAGEGIGALCRAVIGNAQKSPRTLGPVLRLRGLPARRRLLLYLAALLLLAAAFTAGTAFLVHAGGVRGGIFITAVVLAAAASLRCAAVCVDCLVRRLLPPAPTPRMDFSAGLPPQFRTLVVLPALLADGDGIDRLLRNIECHYLNNREANIHFGLLTGFADAPSARLPEDARLLNLARLGILGLNRKYRGDGDGDFFLFHRPRVWSETEKLWTARNRRRGALEDLNRYLVGEDPDAFSRVEGATHRLSGVRCVIVPGEGALPARGAAAAMAGAMAHPLNRPKYDPWRGRVVAGHCALRAGARASLSGANRSLHALLFADRPGVAATVPPQADARQDLLGESPFDSDNGGGVYDVAVAHRALGGRLSAGEIPGHALLAGSVLRAGFLNNTVLYADPPADYAADSERRRRRGRADWRMLSCFARRDGTALGSAGKWWIIDRLLRNLAPLAAVLLIVLALLAGGGRAGAPLFVLAGCVFLSRQRRELPGGLPRLAGRVLFQLACLPYEACVGVGIGGAGMWICPVLAIVPGAAAVLNPSLLPYCAPLFLLWLLAPLCADWLSRPRRPRRETPSAGSVRFLRHIARRSWLFFEDFAGGEENRLPPDRQPESADGAAARTASPGGAGLSLLACLSALDFGYATPGDMLRRCEKTLDALRGLERRDGLFCSAYDTRTLRASPSAAVSVAGNGDLAAHLLVLAQGLREMTGAPVLAANVWDGLLDALQLAQAEAENVAPRVLSGCFDLERAVSRLRAAPPAAPAVWHGQITALEKTATALEAGWSASAPRGAESGRWLRVFIAQCQSALGELGSLLPWAAEMAANPDWAAFPGLAGIPSLLDLVNMAPRMAAPGGGAPAVPPRLLDLVQQASVRAGHRLAVVQKLLTQCEGLAEPDLSLLAHEQGTIDSSGGDALPAVYLGVARNELPQERWFALTGGVGKALSLAPFLVMPCYEGSLLDVACRASGVPDPGLRRESAGGLVIEPHAAALAAMFRPEQAARALRLMASCGFLGAHGFYEAVDFTPRSGRYSVVRSFAAARQGMTLVALAQALLGRPMHRRFLANPVLNSAAILLQETPVSRCSGSGAAAVSSAASGAVRVRAPEERALPASALPS